MGTKDNPNLAKTQAYLTSANIRYDLRKIPETYRKDDSLPEGAYYELTSPPRGKASSKEIRTEVYFDRAGEFDGQQKFVGDIKIAD